MKEFWSYSRFKKIPLEYRLTLGEGQTPFRFIDIDGLKVGIKDENQNPNGSFKDRSLAYQVSYHIFKGKREFAISSSGNAAISAASYCSLARVKLDIFVSNNIKPEKLSKLESLCSKDVILHKSLKPRSDLIKFIAESGATDIRGSKDDSAILGFETIAYEIIDQYPQIDSLFLPCSSGTSALGIINGFKRLKKKIKVYICQTAKVSQMASAFDKDFVKASTSYADAITDRVASRKKEVVSAVKGTDGGGFVVNDALLYQANDYAVKCNLYYSYNSLLGLAGLLKAITKLKNFKYPVVLASGL